MTERKVASDGTVNTRNTISGVVGRVPLSYLDHPVFSEYLVEVDDDAKSNVPELHKPKTADEHNANQATKTAATSGPETR